jgi:hypothetical protein
MKNALATTLPLLAVLLAGCVGVMPVPQSRNQPACGKVITPELVKFVVPGQTTRGEVIARLGDHFRDSPGLPVLAYSWEKPAVGWTWWIFLVGPGAVVAGGGHTEGNHWRAFFVKFDANGRVAATRFVSLYQRKSLDEQLENWAVPKKSGFAKIGARIFNPDNGVPWFIEDMKQNSQYYTASN